MGQVGYLEPEVRDNMLLVVARTVAPVIIGCTVARLINQDLKLHRGSHRGVIHHVNYCDILTPAEVFDSQQVDGPLPDVADCPLSDD